MLKPLSLAVAATLVCASLAAAQTQVPRLAAPTRTPVAATPQQEAAIRAGVALHDKKKYDEAIATYRQVLEENADNVEALYELSYSYLEKRDFAKSVEAARRGTEYKGDMLPMFYDMIATSYEEQGQLPQAVQIYKRALAVQPSSGLIYYNLAVTQREKLKDPNTARQTLKEGAIAAPSFPGVPLLLGQWFEQDGYRTQAFVSLSRALVLDNALQTYALWRRVLKGPENPMAANVMQDPDMRRSAAQSMKPLAAKTDEGDFTAIDARFAPVYAAFLDAAEGDTPEVEALVAQVNGIIDAIAAQPPDRRKPSFISQQYVPFLAALQQKGYVEPFVYWSCARAPVQGVREWMKANEARLREFREWAAAYPFPTSNAK